MYDKQLVVHGNYIYESRLQQLRQLIPQIKETYTQIAGMQEELELSYESQLHKAEFGRIAETEREKDRLMQRSNAGVHKDDIGIQLKDQPFKNIASQGQRKSLLFALKLSEFEILKSAKGSAPLLLLDDVFEKLDADRMHNLLHKVCVENNGQVFITDTHCDRIKEHMTKLNILGIN